MSAQCNCRNKMGPPPSEMSDSSKRYARGAAFTLIELLVIVAMLGILAALLLPVARRTKANARNAVCVSQLRQLGIATRLYAEDNNSRLPKAERLPSLPLFANRILPRICDVLGPYTGEAGATNSGAPVFKCPGDNAQFYEIEGSSYMWNVNLNGRQIDFGQTIRILGVGNNPTNFSTMQIKTNIDFDTASTPLLLDYDDFHPRPPKSGRNVVFMDGHVAVAETDASR